MRNLKKVIALVAVFAMMISTVAFAQSFSDVAESDNYYEAIEMLSSLGILTGDDQDNDGVMDFRANDTITRAEVAVIISRIQGGNNAAQQSTEFTDVPSTHWASGYIAQAAGQGIVNGYGDGTFGPEDQVLYEQAVKMLVETLGYAPFVNDNGGYYTGHLTAASRYGVLDGVVGTSVGAQATRGQVAQMVYNAIDTPLMDRSTYGANAEYVIYDGKGDYDYETLLTRDLGVKKFSGIVTKNSVTSLTGAETIDTDDDATIEVEYDENDDYKNYDVEDIDTIYVGDSNAEEMLGKYVTAYVKEADRNGEYEVVSIAESSKNKITSFTLDMYDSVSDDYGYVYYYKSENDRNTSNVRLEKDVDIIYNGVAYADLIGDLFEDLIVKNTAWSGKVTFVDNDSTTGADVIFVEIGAPAVVEEVTTAGTVTFKESPVEASGEKIKLEFDEDDNTQIIKITKDGQPFDYTELKEWDVLSILYNPANEYYDVRVIGGSAVEGSIGLKGTSETSADKSKYTINGTEYDLAQNAYTNGTMKPGATGVFYIDDYGKIIAYDKNGNTTASDNYGYIIDATPTEDDFGSKSISIQLLDKTGAVQRGYLAERVKIENAPRDLGSTFANDPTRKIDDLSDTEASAFANALVNQLITFATNSSNEVRTITFPVSSRTTENFTLNDSGDASYDEERTRLDFAEGGNYTIDDNTVVFFVKGDSTFTNGIGDSVKASTTASKVGSVASIAEFDSYPAAVYDVDNKVAGAVVIFNTGGGISPASNLAILAEAPGTASVNGDDVTSVTYFMGGEKRTSVTDVDLDGDGLDKLEKAGRGDLFKFAVSADGSTITDVEWYGTYDRSEREAGEAGALITEKVVGNNVVSNYKTVTGKEKMYKGPVVGYRSNGKNIEYAIVNEDGLIDLTEVKNGETHTGWELNARATDDISATGANVYVYDPSRNNNKVYVGDASDAAYDLNLIENVDTAVSLRNGGSQLVAANKQALGMLDYVVAVEYDGDIIDVVIYKAYDFGRYTGR